MKALQPLPQEHIRERVEDVLASFDPLIKEDIEEMLQLVPQEYSEKLVVGQHGSILFD